MSRYTVLTHAFLNGERKSATEDVSSPGTALAYREAYDLRNTFLAHVLARYGVAEVTVSADGSEYAVRRPNGYVRYINLVEVPA